MRRLRFSGHYPERITVIGYGMKRARYQDVHRMAIRWPEDKFDYIGIDNEGDTKPDYEGEVRFLAVGRGRWLREVDHVL